MSKRRKREFTPRQRKFAELYVQNGGNAYQAAVDAGYSHYYAKTHGGDLVRKCRPIIDELQAEARKRAQVTIEDLIRYWWEVAEGQREPDAPASVRMKATELLGKALGAFTERREVSVNGAFVVALPDPEDA